MKRSGLTPARVARPALPSRPCPAAVPAGAERSGAGPALRTEAAREAGGAGAEGEREGGPASQEFLQDPFGRALPAAPPAARRVRRCPSGGSAGPFLPARRRARSAERASERESGARLVGTQGSFMHCSFSRLSPSLSSSAPEDILGGLWLSIKTSSSLLITCHFHRELVSFGASGQLIFFFLSFFSSIWRISPQTSPPPPFFFF